MSNRALGAPVMKRLILIVACAVLALDGRSATAQSAAETLLFSDDFANPIPPDDGLGATWKVSGLWYADGAAVSDLDDVDQAIETAASCGDCRAEAQIGGAGPETGLSLRMATAGDRYDAVILADGTLRIRRVRGGVPSTLVEAPAGLADPTDAFTLSLSAAGTNPVRLSASVNGAPIATAADSDPAALGASRSRPIFIPDWDFGASPTLYDLPDGRHLIAAANKNGFVYALDRDNLASGPLWTSLISGSGASPDFGESTIVSAAYADGLLFVGGGATTDGFPGAIAALDPATGVQQWQVNPDGFVLPALTAVGDVLIAPVSRNTDRSGTLYLLDQKTGEVLFTLPTPARLFSQATWAHGMLYVVDEEGNLFALRPASQ